MNDLLYYRIPNELVVSKTGAFNNVQSFENVEGFILTSFDKKEKFVFEEGDRNGVYSYSGNSPFCIQKEDYLNTTKNFLNEFSEKGISKAIYSRIKKTNISASEIELFDSLCENYPDTFVYLISSAEFGTWIGATPEKLLDVKENSAETVALAGTLRVDESKEWSEKEIEEQQLVTDFISQSLEQEYVSEVQQSKKQELVAGPVKHLATSFHFQLKMNTALPLVEVLHPTPAVSGFPRKGALDLISKYEKHNRSLYAGIIGVTSNDRTNLFVNLRCAQIIDKSAYLYVGGGFTKDSSCEKEWLETESKAETLQKVFEKN